MLVIQQSSILHMHTLLHIKFDYITASHINKPKLVLQSSIYVHYICTSIVVFFMQVQQRIGYCPQVGM